MNGALTKVLLVENDAADAAVVQAALAGAGDSSFLVEWVRQLPAALACARQGEVTIILLDLRSSASPGIGAFSELRQAAPNALILILATASDEELARQAVRAGAIDYLIKDQVDAHWLPRALRYLLERQATQAALVNSEARFRAISDASPLGLFVSDMSGNCIYTNAAYHKISGLTFEQALGTSWSMAIHPDDRQRLLLEWRTAARDEVLFLSEVRFLRSDGSLVWTRLNAALMSDGGKSLGYVQTVEDISERKVTESILRTAEDALFEEKERAQVTLNSIGDAVLTTSLQGKVAYLNLVAETMTGWSREEALGRPLDEVFKIIDGGSRQTAANPALRAIAEDRTVGLSADCLLIRRDGAESAIEDSAAPIHNRDGLVSGAVIVFHDVSESRAMALKMAHLAQHDFLTGLPNRVLLSERLAQAIGMAQRHRRLVGLIFLDLDNFKHINDSLGHAIGDLLLQSVAERLKTCVRTSDTVCRQGGDEFVILLPEIEQPQAAAQIAEKLLDAFAGPHLIGSRELHISLSIGISIYPDDSLNAETVMQNADTAMYHAKSDGRNNFQFFRSDMNTRAVQRLFIESSLRRALKDNEFVIHYQAQIDLASGVLSGCEALIRWQDPALGLVFPGQFVPIAEESGLIVPIGRWVLREACRQVQTWLLAGVAAVPVAVNISAVEFRHKGFVDGVALILSETGLPPAYLELELTESILMQDAAASASTLEALKAMGIQLAIDDFGTGYSSLSYLKRFPIDTLKIDQSFVRDISIDADDATIVSAIIGMGRNLKQRVIAEGIETAEQLAFLRRQQCDAGQGYLFGHPLAAAGFLASLAGKDGPSFPLATLPIKD